MPSSIKDTLIKTDAKFYAIHSSPSEYKLRTIGNIEQEQAEAMKRYIREVFIPEYANNFNKGLSEADIKFYGKIHFDRSRSDNELNLHCHLIVSRKDQANKKKLSPLTNHKDTKKGTLTGGFDRVNLFQQAEQGFDKLFSYNRQQNESFGYYNTMKNGAINERFALQKQEFKSCERKTEVSQDSNIDNLVSINLENKEANNQDFHPNTYTIAKQKGIAFFNPSFNQGNNQTSGSFTSLEAIFPFYPEEQKPKLKKKKGRRL